MEAAAAGSERLSDDFVATRLRLAKYVSAVDSHTAASDAAFTPLERQELVANVLTSKSVVTAKAVVAKAVVGCAPRAVQTGTVVAVGAARLLRIGELAFPLLLARGCIDRLREVRPLDRTSL